MLYREDSCDTIRRNEHYHITGENKNGKEKQTTGQGNRNAGLPFPQVRLKHSSARVLVTVNGQVVKMQISVSILTVIP